MTSKTDWEKVAKQIIKDWIGTMIFDPQKVEMKKYLDKVIAENITTD